MNTTKTSGVEKAREFVRQVKTNRKAVVMITGIILLLCLPGLILQGFKTLDDRKYAEFVDRGEVARMSSTSHVMREAQNGDPVCQCELGRRLVSGDRIRKDTDAGARWLIKSAEQGNYDAVRVLCGWWRDEEMAKGEGALWNRDHAFACRFERVLRFNPKGRGIDEEFARYVKRTDAFITGDDAPVTGDDVPVTGADTRESEPRSAQSTTPPQTKSRQGVRPRKRYGWNE